MEYIQVNYSNLEELKQVADSPEYQKNLRQSGQIHIMVMTSLSDAMAAGRISCDMRHMFPQARFVRNHQQTIANTKDDWAVGIKVFFTDTDQNSVDENCAQNERTMSGSLTCSGVDKQFCQLVEKNKLIEYYNSQLNDSLKYACKIQKAVIPPREYFTRLFPQHFILYRPKNIVSGDFFWAFDHGNTAYLVVADCTGHGVPGALMSVLGITLLNEISKSLQATYRGSAPQMLSQLRSAMRETLHQSGKLHELRDGMDIALCVIDKVGHQMEYAGAFIPLYIVRNGVLTEYHASKIPIDGCLSNTREFGSHDIELNTGDMLFLATDGFADQFGGAKLKKFKRNNLKSLFTAIADKEMHVQKLILADTLDLWQNGTEQIDDITVFGMRIEAPRVFTFEI